MRFTTRGNTAIEWGLSMTYPTVDDQTLRPLTDELAQLVLDQVAPEELVLYDETAADYYADPQALLNPKSRDEALGFGLELVLLTPVVIAVAQSVGQWLAGAVIDATVKESSSTLVDYLRKRLRRNLTPPSGQRPAPLTPEQLSQVKTVAYQRAVAIGVDPVQAGLIADATAGALVSTGERDVGAG